MTDSNGDRCSDDEADAGEPRGDEREASDADEKREGNLDDVLGAASTGERLGIPIEALSEIELRRDLEQGESVVDAVLSVVSELQECDPLDLPPLYEAIDPVTLESTWSANRNVATRSSRVVWCTFVFDRTLVTVTSTGELYAGLLDDGEAAASGSRAPDDETDGE